MDGRTVIIVSIYPRGDQRWACPSLCKPARIHPHYKGLAFDLALGDHPTVHQDDRHPPVVKVVQAIVLVDVGQLRLLAELS